MKNLFSFLALICISTAVLAKEAPKKDFYEYNGLIETAKILHPSDDDFLKKIEACSERGNKYCSLMTGITYFRKDEDAKAFKHLSNADCEFRAEDGKLYWAASFYLGTLHFGGLGTPIDNEKAIEQFKHCAYMGKAPCAFMLASIYGIVNRTNHVPAYAWMQVAGKMGMNQIPERKYETVPQDIEMMQDVLSTQQRLDGDKLANEICSAIPECDITK